ncbi:uncharacterized protein MELLADRAFT_107043 [Melampsora larici-populina 98AG31]|uniref:Uncharacterized protein n=1 Tax=Melampsora larici-populina (strain 98AG31 / pathotype 3-4-7) TaxID=747676 RepID=F4RNH0_MELLP|nr:uncharacterized protein MELLADRAFT_107043 [Melampsora larici-populina 98AG31]EGG05987.1 hypothetical protein MELLADRAFT_107043 [Melampsora larici-populina 98AG31]
MEENKKIVSKLPPMEERLIKICKLIGEMDMSPKTFIQNFLTSTDIVIKERRGKWGTKKGWNGTKLLMTTIGELVKSDEEDGLTRWSKEFILEEMRDNQSTARTEKKENQEHQEVEHLEGNIDGDELLRRSPNALPRIEEY